MYEYSAATASWKYVSILKCNHLLLDYKHHHLHYSLYYLLVPPTLHLMDQLCIITALWIWCRLEECWALLLQYASVFVRYVFIIFRPYFVPQNNVKCISCVPCVYVKECIWRSFVISCNFWALWFVEIWVHCMETDTLTHNVGWSEEFLPVTGYHIRSFCDSTKTSVFVL